MARLAFGGHDTGHVHAEGLAQTVSVLSAPTYDATVRRGSSGRSLKVAAVSQGGSAYQAVTFTGVASRAYFLRFWLYFDAYPSTDTQIATVLNGASSTNLARLQLKTDGTIASAVAGITPSAPLALSTWHCVELKLIAYATGGTGPGQGAHLNVRVNGVDLAGESVTSTVQLPDTFRQGITTALPSSSNVTLYFEDWAINDDTGAADNSWPGTAEKIALLLPTADNAVSANWKLGDGTSTAGNAHNSVDNVPPTGRATAAAGDQISNAVNDVTSPNADADFSLQTYTAAGVGVGDAVKHLFAVIEASPATAAAQNVGVALVSNPAISETVGATGASATGTYPTNWTRIVTPVAQPGSEPAHGTAPVLRVGRRTASANALRVALAGLYVAYEPGGLSLAPQSIPTGEAIGHPTLANVAPQTLAPASIPSQESVGRPTLSAGVATLAPASIPTEEAVGRPALSHVAPQTLAPASVPTTEAVGRPTLTQTPPAEPETPASGLFVELTTLHYPDTPAKVLAVCQEYDGLEVAIPLAVTDVRTGKVTLSIYDDAVLKPVLDYLESNGEDEAAYAICLRVRYYGMPVLWGPITLPEWNGGPATVTLNAVGPELRLQHQYLKDGDPTSSGPLAESGKYAMSTEGLRYLRDAGINEPADNTHNVPDLGIVDGSEAAIPPELSPVPRLTFRRHDEIWRAMQELSGHELAPDFEIAPVFNVPGAYAKLNCYFPQGTDRTGAVRFYYGFGPDNLADFTSTPGGKIVTRATYVSSDDKVRKRATAWDSASFRGIYGQVEATDYDSTTDSVGEALTLRAKREVRRYREPPKSLKITLKPERAITDPRRRYRYGRDFLVGDTVYVNAKKGWMRYDGDARITKVTLRQAKEGVVADLELVPDVGDGTPETGDG